MVKTKIKLIIFWHCNSVNTCTITCNNFKSAGSIRNFEVCITIFSLILVFFINFEQLSSSRYIENQDAKFLSCCVQKCNFQLWSIVFLFQTNQLFLKLTFPRLVLILQYFTRKFWVILTLSWRKFKFGQTPFPSSDNRGQTFRLQCFTTRRWKNLYWR